MGHCRFTVLALLFLPLLQAQSGGVITGTTIDGHAGQALSNVAIQLIGTTYQTQSDADGHFALSNLTSGDYELHASTVGYRMVITNVHIDPDEKSQLQLILSPDAFRRVDTVTVQSGSLFHTGSDDAVSNFSLAGNDLKNLGTVLADDPLRAVQAVPGV